jgi:phosphomevalonate kinase
LCQAGGYDAIFALLVSDDAQAANELQQVENVWAAWTEMTVQALLVRQSADGIAVLLE